MATTRTGTIEEENKQEDPAEEKVEVEVEETEETESDALAESYTLDELKPDDEIFPGGPTKKQIEAWKEEHDEIYVTTVGLDVNLVWRTLTRFEYRRLVKAMEQAVSSGTLTEAEANLNNEELITEICLLWPTITKTELQGKMAGLASVISSQAMEASGFIATDVRQL